MDDKDASNPDNTKSEHEGWSDIREKKRGCTDCLFLVTFNVLCKSSHIYIYMFMGACMYVSICIYIQMNVYFWIHVFTYVSVSLYRCLYLCTSTYMYMKNVYVHECPSKRMRINVCLCIYKYMYIYVYMYIYMCIYMYV
jgi:hypothetical protein